jgi:threonine/homoserine/homoserine lactone efflux protein
MFVALLEGITFSTAPILSFGPFKIFVLSTALELGWRRSLYLALTPLIADIPVILVLWFLLARLPGTVIEFLRIAGGVFFIYLGTSLIRRLRSPAKRSSQPNEVRRSLLQAILAVWITPNVYVNWGIVGVPALISYAQESALTAAAFLLGFYVFWIAGLALQIFIAGQAGRFSAEAPRLLVYIGSLLLFGFGLFQVWQGIANVFFS